jgi:hypothetical protein
MRLVLGLVAMAAIVGSINAATAAEPKSAAFSSDGLGAPWITIARNGRGFHDAFADTARVCSVSGGAALQIASGPVGDTAKPPATTATIAVGKCGCIAAPDMLIAQNAKAGAAFAGTYEWMSQAFCNALPTTRSAAAVPPSTTPTTDAKCEAGSTDDEFPVATCPITLPAGEVKRVCLKDGWIHVTAGDAYPTRYVTLVVDPALLKIKTAPNDLRWSYVGTGCVDLGGVSKAWFVVHGDATFAAKIVNKVSYSAGSVR